MRVGTVRAGGRGRRTSWGEVRSRIVQGAYSFFNSILNTLCAHLNVVH